jgi:hypothetical protein
MHRARSHFGSEQSSADLHQTARIAGGNERGV